MSLELKANHKIGRATKLVTVKMPQAQHGKFLELGGSKWLKRMIDAALGKPAAVDKAVGGE